MSMKVMESSKKLIILLPHRAVVKNKRETSKITIAYDGSSNLKNESSINEFLKPGPCLFPLPYDKLLRFRLGSFFFHKQLGSGLNPQSCLYLEGFKGSKFLNGWLLV